MYKIVGGDQQQYGPVSADDIRRWIAEGRANAETQALAEGATAWQPLSAFPEFADALRTAPVPAVTVPAAAVLEPWSPEAVLARDYDLDIGACITRSWELVKQHFWPIVGITLLIMVAVFGINQLLGLISRPALNDMILNRRFSPGAILLVVGVSVLSTPVYTIFVAGLFNYYIKLIRGESPTIGDAFAGFSSATGQLVMYGLVTGILGIVAFCFCILPGLYLTVAWTFGLPLVIDRRLNFWAAMELSRKAVTKHWFLVFALVLVVGLLSACGFIACCIGLLVTVPIGWVALMYAYEDIFGSRAA
jgi:hypothetical protein